MAVAIINGERKTETAALRDWAVDLLALQAEGVLPLSEEAREELRSRRVYIGGTPTSYEYKYDHDYGDYYDFDHRDEGREVAPSNASVRPAPPARREQPRD